MNAGELLELFAATADAVRDAVRAIQRTALRDRTERPGQYALDLVADRAACEVLGRAPVRIVSEESGAHDRPGAAITVVVDPVDGSTNCARGIAYWSTSLCAVDAGGPLVALVANHPTGQRTVAVRGQGARRDGISLRASRVARIDDSVIGLGGLPAANLGWKQSRTLGCCSLLLCEVAAGGLDGYLDPGRYHAPWDYLGAMLACTEAGAVVRDASGEALVPEDLGDVAQRRQIVAAGTAALADILAEGAR